MLLSKNFSAKIMLVNEKPVWQITYLPTPDYPSGYTIGYYDTSTKKFNTDFFNATLSQLQELLGILEILETVEQVEKFVQDFRMSNPGTIIE